MFDQQRGMLSLLVTRDPALAHPLKYLFLVILKHRFETISSFQKISELEIDLSTKSVVLVHVPRECDGEIQAVDRLKSLDKKPVIIVLRERENNCGIDAFLAGADDVVQWPCPLEELAARVGVRLGHVLDREHFRNGKVQWETEAYISERAQLTTVEAEILRVLYSRQGEIVSRDEMSHAIDGRPWQYGDRKFDVHVGRIRKKFSREFGPEISVATVRSSGYRLLTVNQDGGDGS